MASVVHCGGAPRLQAGESSPGQMTPPSPSSPIRWVLPSSSPLAMAAPSMAMPMAAAGALPSAMPSLSSLLTERAILTSLSPPLPAVLSILDAHITSLQLHAAAPFPSAAGMGCGGSPPTSPTSASSPSPGAGAPLIRKRAKVSIPTARYPTTNFVGRLLGPRGLSLQSLERSTSTRIMIRGRGSVRKDREASVRGKPGWEHVFSDPLHVVIEVDVGAGGEVEADRRLKSAKEAVELLLVPVAEERDALKRAQLRELAILNGSFRGGGGGGGGLGGVAGGGVRVIEVNDGVGAATGGGGKLQPIGTKAPGGPCAANLSGMVAGVAASPGSDCSSLTEEEGGCGGEAEARLPPSLDLDSWDEMDAGAADEAGTPGASGRRWGMSPMTPLAPVGGIWAPRVGGAAGGSAGGQLAATARPFCPAGARN